MESQGGLDIETFNSQELMEYLHEYRCVSLDGEDPTDEEIPQEEEGEEEAEWLRAVGFDPLMADRDPTSESADTEWEGFATLSNRQAAVVKRRLQTLRDTLHKRRSKERRRPDMRRLFPSSDTPSTGDSTAIHSGGSTGSGGGSTGSGGGSTGTRSRSATPDSLDSLTPPLTPPEVGSRLQAGSPGSQGYHSSSRGSLDRLEGVDADKERSSEYRHVLRIPLEVEPKDWQRDETGRSREHHYTARDDSVHSRPLSRATSAHFQSLAREEIVPHRSVSREESFSHRSVSREESFPHRSVSREESFPHRSVSREESFPHRSVSREESFPHRSVSREESFPHRSVSRDESFPYRSVSREEFFPHRSVSRDESFPHRSVSREESFPHRSVSREESAPHRSLSREEPVTHRPLPREKPHRPLSREKPVRARPLTREESAPARTPVRPQVRSGRYNARDVADRPRPSLGQLFETSGNYDLSKPPAQHSDSSGIETVSFHPIGSVRRHSAVPTAAELGRTRLSRVRSASKPEIGLMSSAAAVIPSTGDTSRSAEERLGITHLEDLSDADIQRVQKLALIELTGLFDEHGLSCSRRKARRRRLGARASSDAAVLGASLTSLLKRDRQLREPASPAAPDSAVREPPVPRVFETILTHLERHGLREEGLLRVPGHRGKTDRLRQLLDEAFYSRPAAVAAALQRSSAADVAALLKQLLRELPTPLLTDALLEAFHRTDSLPAREQREALTLLCLRLPAASRALLRRLLRFLATVAAHERANKMSLENVAMIMAPNLLPARRRQRDIKEEIAFAAVTSRVVRRLVQHRHRLWEVAAQFVRQVRQQNEEELYERARREVGGPMKLLLRRRDTAIVRKIDNEVDFQEGVLRVAAEQFGRGSWPVRLMGGTTAGDLVTSCIRESLLVPEAPARGDGYLQNSTPGGSTVCSLQLTDLASALSTHFLHERGGNIGERRLAHDALLLDCYQENPNARWVLHCFHGGTSATRDPGSEA